MMSRILTSRLATNGLPCRPLLTPSCQMSTEVDKPKREVKRESFLSLFSLMFGGKADHYDPSQPPIPASEINLPDTVEHATGENKLLLLAFEQGILDPYCNLPIERKGRGTKDNPILIESFTNWRKVGCVCEDSQNHIIYTNVYQDEPKRCPCGHWMKVVDAPRFWTKIPKEDLITIPYFMELEMEGKLDDLLAGKEPETKHEISSH